MIGAVALTLSPDRFRQLHGRAVLMILVVQIGMPLLVFGIAPLLGLSPALTAGFVIRGAVTPELVTPTMTELSGGDTAHATVVLIVVGLGTLVLIPSAVTVLLGVAVSVDPLLIVKQLVLPMTLAIAVRYRWPKRVGQYDELYPSVSRLMMILIIGIVTTANASLVRDGGSVFLVAIGAVGFNVIGYAVGWLVS